MSAVEMGVKRGRDYLRRHSVETLATMTLEQFCAMGRLDARQHYKQKKAQDDYVLGWWNVGKSFLTLFKPDDHEQFVAERELKHLQSLLNNAEKTIQKLLQWRKGNVTLSTYLDHALGDVEEAQGKIHDAVDYLKRPQERQA